MILAVDIGNSNIVLGVFDGDDIIGNWRMVTRKDKTSDEYGIFILNSLKYSNIEKNKIKSAIVSSVVPNVMHSFENALKKYFDIEPIIVGPGIKTGITISNDNPREVGADRIVGLVAAYDMFGGPLIVIDFGTATTYDILSENGEFKYGVTAPGLQITADALWQRTAKLPSVEIKKPDSILARNTIASIQAGLVYGYIGQAEYIVKKIKEEMGIEMKVLATGGLGRIVYNETSMIDHYDPQLLFKGLKILHDKNQK
jgi:type III pantothenate kinase